jgi:hypothetical protein
VSVSRAPLVEAERMAASWSVVSLSSRPPFALPAARPELMATPAFGASPWHGAAPKEAKDSNAMKGKEEEKPNDRIEQSGRALSRL